MKSIFKYMAILAAGIGLAACSPEEYEGASGNVPQASDYADNFTITVDQSTNTATFEFISAPGVTPVWVINGAYSTENSFTRFYRKAGTYSVEWRVTSTCSRASPSANRPSTMHRDGRKWPIRRTRTLTAPTR